MATQAVPAIMPAIVPVARRTRGQAGAVTQASGEKKDHLEKLAWSDVRKQLRKTISDARRRSC